MFAGETVVSLFFKMLNFGLIIGLFAYLFKRSILPAAREQMVEKEALVESLKQHKEQLKQEQKALEQQLEAQAEELKHLGDKVAVWHIAFTEQMQRKHDEAERLKSLLSKKVMVQEHNIKVALLQSSVLPKALHEATVELKKEFSAEYSGRDFIKKLITSMERSRV